MENDRIVLIVLIFVGIVGVLGLVTLFTQSHGVTGNYAPPQYGQPQYSKTEGSGTNPIIEELEAHKTSFQKTVRELDGLVRKATPQVKGGAGGFKGGNYRPPTQYLKVSPAGMLTAMNKYLEVYKEHRLEFSEYLLFLQNNQNDLMKANVNILDLEKEIKDTRTLYDNNIGIFQSNVRELEQQYELNDKEKELALQFWEKVQIVFQPAS